MMLAVILQDLEPLLIIFKQCGMLSKFYLKRFLIVHFNCTVLEVFLCIPCALHLFVKPDYIFSNNLYTCLKNDENPLS